MPNFTLNMQQEPDTQQDSQTLTQMIGLTLLPKARSLWEEWLTQGQLVEVEGYWRWADEPHPLSNTDPEKDHD